MWPRKMCAQPELQNCACSYPDWKSFSEAIGDLQLDSSTAQRLCPSPTANAQIRWAATLVLVGLTCANSQVTFNFHLDYVAA